MRIDLHTHSAYSDGTDTPAALIAAAAAAGLDVVGIADHDSNAGWAEALAAAEQAGVELVRGAEITSSWQGASVHILSYLHDPAVPELAQLMADNRDLRPRRARKMVAALAADYPITWEQVLAFAGDQGTVGRPHMADALVAAGIYPDRNAAFADALARSSPYYVHLTAPSPLEVVRAIRVAGGVPVLAHPFVAKRGRMSPEGIAELVPAGLFAIEADHRDHTPEQRATARALARDLGILVTGSSDYHGTGKPNRLGEGLTSPEVLAAIRAAGRI